MPEQAVTRNIHQCLSKRSPRHSRVCRKRHAQVKRIGADALDHAQRHDNANQYAVAEVMYKQVHSSKEDATEPCQLCPLMLHVHLSASLFCCLRGTALCAQLVSPRCFAMV
eukprot:1140069-Pelagomonas_calceolata.AAC.2